MAYSVNFSRQAFKDLEKINEPFYTPIKQAILPLSSILFSFKLSGYVQ